jgi:hypothetical protein
VRIVGVLGADGRLCPTSWPGCPSGIALDTAGFDDASGVVSAVGWYDGERILLAAPLADAGPVTIRSSGRQDPASVFDLDVEDGVQPVSGMGTSPETGREVVDIEAIDSRGMDAITSLRGVDAAVFVELLDRPLSDLPA